MIIYPETQAYQADRKDTQLHTGSYISMYTYMYKKPNEVHLLKAFVVYWYSLWFVYFVYINAVLSLYLDS